MHPKSEAENLFVDDEPEEEDETLQHCSQELQASLDFNIRNIRPHNVFKGCNGLIRPWPRI